MASITIRNLDDNVKKRLRKRAAENGRSVEAEARAILSDGVAPQSASGNNLFDAIRRRFTPLGGIEIEPFPDEVLWKPSRTPRSKKA
jgi:plasmid stability protein